MEKIGNKKIRNLQLNKKHVKIPNIWISGKDCAYNFNNWTFINDQRIWYNKKLLSLLTKTQPFLWKMRVYFYKIWATNEPQTS